MRTMVTKFAVVAVIVVMSFAVLPSAAKADSGAPYNASDGRIAPLTGDRLAVYCNTATVDVWGIDSDAVGFHGTTFGLAELQSKQTVAHQIAGPNGTSLGTMTLSFDSAAQYTSGFADYSATTWETIASVGAVYHVTWVGAYGADGSAPFVKHFSCTY